MIILEIKKKVQITGVVNSVIIFDFPKLILLRIGLKDFGR